MSIVEQTVHITRLTIGKTVAFHLESQLIVKEKFIEIWSVFVGRSAHVVESANTKGDFPIGFDMDFVFQGIMAILAFNH